jgi:hypothetical protein
MKSFQPNIETAESIPNVIDANEQLSSVSRDLNVELIHDAVFGAYDGYVNQLTKFAPCNGKGQTLYVFVTDRFRERMCKLGWTKSDMYQVSCVYNKEQGVRISCTTDGGPAVGQKGCAPALRTKGNGTIRLAGHSGCETMRIPYFEHDTPENPVHKTAALSFYYLLVYLDEVKQEIRIELSRPEFNTQGEITHWVSRIILPPVNLVPVPSIDLKSAPTPTIHVEKRKIS